MPRRSASGSLGDRSHDSRLQPTGDRRYLTPPSWTAGGRERRSTRRSWLWPRGRTRAATYEFGQPPIRGFAINNEPGFWLKNGKVAKDLYVAFTAKSADAVRASYKAIDAGATSIKEPSLRPEWRADYFAANIGDPDGYNIEIAYKPWLYK